MVELTPLSALLLLAGGILAGIINAMAGGGSLITLPLLVFVGLSPTAANASNRVAVVVQSLASTAAYQSKGALEGMATRRALPALMFGAGVGAWVATRLDDDAFRPILAVVLVLVAGLLVLKPERWITPRAAPMSPPAVFGLLFLTGFQGGFIQAGVGFTLLATLVLGMGLDLARANAVKIVAALFMAGLALAIFASQGQVAWAHGLVLSVGNGIGGYLGARLALAKGATWIRWTLLVMVAASIAKMMW